mmetsp:Transcript_19759/g.28164  ORF Transcript_19759/g.28164 Transcript_19759/m.28164 type:complete len:161 (+) Transcript_19759:337-819(+)|eukprot:CAMPEP_0172430076 /NCGR_PEP_ID=MMETSP1064-20121228/53004_1 /TAXON_ID=202472 /ORGANISM="Aulacoseira subarctica , Strain CCAP 1002/5" /LENGTH=160 /DNA_ID=CAMNT_0013175893 /DNA_START=264 /DNA_END=746 /DNA_ORIENTATION=+
MKIFSTVFALFLSAEVALGAKKTGSLRKLQSSTACTDFTLYGEGSAPNSTPLAAGEIVTAVIPLFSDDSLTTEVAEWEFYCTGLGTDQDPAGGQICTSIFAIEGGESEGQMTGTSVYDAGEPEMDVVVTGGIGDYLDASGGVVVTYGDGTYTVAFSVSCA